MQPYGWFMLRLSRSLVYHALSEGAFREIMRLGNLRRLKVKRAKTNPQLRLLFGERVTIGGPTENATGG